MNSDKFLQYKIEMHKVTIAVQFNQISTEVAFQLYITISKEFFKNNLNLCDISLAI